LENKFIAQKYKGIISFLRAKNKGKNKNDELKISND